LRRIDSGSNGVVFLARRADDPEAPPVALKLAKQEEDPRFEREARLLQLVQHPNIPCLYGIGLWTSADGRHYPFIVMEWVDGAILYDWFRKQPRSSLEVLRVLAPVAHALAAVHAQGAIHRDVKGDNIRVTPEGRAVLLDFGACWFPDARPITDTIAPPGTAPYRPPELLRFMWKNHRDYEARWEARPSDDLYSLGVTAYRLVTSTYPPPVSETRDAEPRKLPRPSELATVAPELEGIILRLLSEDRQARGTATQNAKALERAALQAGPELASPIRPLPPAVSTEDGVPPRFTSSSDLSRSDSESESEDSSRSDSARPSTEPEREVLRSTFPLWLSWVTATAVGGFMMFAATELWHGRDTPDEPPVPIADEHHVPPIDAPDAGVLEEALASAQDFPRVEVPLNALGRPVPKEPFPGQRKPPCNPKVERVINGACWAGGIEKPPCGPGAYDYEERCYMPSFNPPRLPTSGEP
jgi:serine/threonine protein kinase